MKLAEPSQRCASASETAGARKRPPAAAVKVQSGAGILPAFPAARKRRPAPVVRGPTGPAHLALKGGNCPSLSKAMTALWPLCLALSLAGTSDLASAATITNYFGGPYAPQPQNLAINTGDTVVWVTTPQGGADYVESYGGEWKSPLLGAGASFSVTFTNPGFYAYRTSESAQTGRTSGTVTVIGWTNQPPPVTINAPMDGFLFAGGQTAFVQASVTNPAETVLVQYFANANLIGSATNPPYALQWQLSAPGANALVAKATDRQGTVTESLPVNVQALPVLEFVWGPRMLPTGAFLFFYNCGLRGGVYVSDDPSFANPGTVGSTIFSFGMFVDESAPGSGGGPRYYQIRGGG